MDKQNFIEEMTKKITEKPAHHTDEQIKRCHMAYINYHKKSKPDEILVIPMEEMAELMQHLSKIIRGKEVPDDIGVLEELADVQICIDNLKIHFGIDEEKFKYAMDVKFERADRKIKKGTA